VTKKVVSIVFVCVFVRHRFIEGTTAVRTDINKNYILSQADASILSNWVQLATPDASIQSVNGQTGTVLLTKADLSLANVNNTSDADKPLSSAATSN
jgi:hypothetical protein